MQEKKFPDNFYWGCATASHQIEGNTHNDWSEWEQSAKRLAQLKREGKDSVQYISGRNSDSYGNNNANIACLTDLGANAYRWSLEWSRIEPRPGEFQEDVLEHYRDFCKKLRARGIEPFVTIWHWTNPIWIRDLGGWSSPQVVEHFTRYVEKVAEYLGDEVKMWITINEPQVIAGASYLKGEWPPQQKNPIAFLRVLRHLKQAHIAAYEVLKKVNPDNQIGISKHNIYFEPHRDWLHNTLLASFYRWWWNDHFLRQIAAHQDFIGLNYYFHSRVSVIPRHSSKHPAYDRYSDMGWGLYPDGIYHVLKELQQYDKPIYITEAGLADKDDKHRAWYVRALVEQMQRAITDGVPVRGFFYWSLIDNFEWSHGYGPCFGLYEVNYQTLERTARPSAAVYREIIADNAVRAHDEM